MRSGRLRNRVTFERYTVTRDAYGDEVQSWATLATVWGAVEFASGNERFSNEQNLADAMYRVLVRWSSTLSDLSPADRMLFDGKVYDIHSVNNRDARDRDLDLSCKVRDE